MIINPSNLYSGQQGILRDNVVDYVTKLELQKRAKDEALDKYYQGLPNTVNDKGVRDQEIPILHEAKNKIQNYWMVNRDAIRKGNTPEAYNYGKMFREAQGLVQESKNRAATAEKLSKLRGNPKYDYIFRSPKLIEQIDAHERPIGTDGAQGINFDQITLPPAPFDQQKYRQGLKDIKPEYDITYETNPQDKFSKFEVKTPKLNKEQLDKVTQYAATELYNNPSFESEIKDKIKTDAALAPALHKVFTEKFGRDIQSDADLATAYTLNTLPFPTERKAVKDVKAVMDAANREWDRRRPLKIADQKEMEATRQAYKNASEEQKTKAVKGFVDAEVKFAMDNPVPLEGKDFNIAGVKQTITPYKLRTSPSTLNLFTQEDEPGNKYTPKDIYYNPSKGTFILKGGEINGGDREITRPEYEAVLVNKVFSSRAKQNQIDTDEEIEGDKKTSSSGSSSKKTTKTKPAWAL